MRSPAHDASAIFHDALQMGDEHDACMDRHTAEKNALRELHRDFVRKCMDATGLECSALARKAGLSPSTLNRFMNSDVAHVLSSGTIAALSRAAHIAAPHSPEGNMSPGMVVQDGFTLRPIDVPQPAELRRDLPVLGHAIGGNDGEFVMNGQVNEYAERPLTLAGVSNAYAVYVNGTSMEPRLMEGWLLHVHPAKPPTTGSFVVVQVQGPPGSAAPHAFIKEFVRRAGGKLIVKQHNPERELEWPLSSVVSVHRVIGIAGL